MKPHSPLAASVPVPALSMCVVLEILPCVCCFCPNSQGHPCLFLLRAPGSSLCLNYNAYLPQVILSSASLSSAWMGLGLDMQQVFVTDYNS